MSTNAEKIRPDCLVKNYGLPTNLKVLKARQVVKNGAVAVLQAQRMQLMTALAELKATIVSQENPMFGYIHQRISNFHRMMSFLCFQTVT